MTTLRTVSTQTTPKTTPSTSTATKPGIQRTETAAVGVVKETRGVTDVVDVNARSESKKPLTFEPPLVKPSPVSLDSAALDDALNSAANTVERYRDANDAGLRQTFREAGEALERVKKATSVEMPLRLAVTTGKPNALATTGDARGRSVPQEVLGVVKSDPRGAVFYPADEAIRPFPLSAEQAEVLPKNTLLVARATKKKVEFQDADGAGHATVYQLGAKGPVEPRGRFVGTVDLIDGAPFVRDLVPPPRAFPLPKTQPDGSAWHEGAIVNVEKGAVTKQLAEAGSAKARTWMIAADNRLDATFPDAALTEKDDIVAAAARMLNDPSLVDRRHEPFFAIDNPGSTDIDQAMRLTKRPDGGYIVDYALADAAAYIKPGMALFNEAMQRGASYYLPGLSIPMLPDALSEGVISLNAHEDHRAMIISVHLDKDGNVEKNSVSRAVIHSQAQLTYEGVSAELEGKGKIGADEHNKPVPKAVREQLALFQEIGEKRIVKAKERGVVEPERREMHIDTSQGHFALKDSKSDYASKLNAEFSIMANVGGAEQFLSSTVPGISVPALFRVHQEPGDGAYAALARQTATIVREHKLPSSWAWQPQQESLASWVERIKTLPTTDRERELSMVLQSASIRINVASEYSTTPGAHSGLKVDSYGRFSAPMREQVGVVSHAIVFAKDALERAFAGVEQGGAKLSVAEAQALWAPLLLGSVVAPKDIPQSRQALAAKAQELLSAPPAQFAALAQTLAKQALTQGPITAEEQKLVDDVVNRARGAGNSGKMRQAQVEGAARKLLFDDLFMKDLGGDPNGSPNAPKREGFITAVTPGRVYIQLRDPDIEVRLATDDLRHGCKDARFQLTDEGCTLVTDDKNAGAVARLTVGHSVNLQAVAHDGDRLRFAIVD